MNQSSKDRKVELPARLGTILPTMESRAHPRILDYLLVAAFCAVLFGYSAFSGRPLTMHEARLPQTSREMLTNHVWLLPTSGGRPWLERPPFPHWVVITAMRIFDHSNRVWVVRMPSALMGSVTVLSVVWLAGRVFGRRNGLISGLMLATSYEFYAYSSLAEDDIYLAALVAIAAASFFKASLIPASTRRFHLVDFFTLRSPIVLGFFFVLGLTNLAKGPLLGLLILGTPIAAFLIWQSFASGSLQPMLRFTWLWGWLVVLGLTFAWPVWAYRHFPDVLDNWRYDYLGRVTGAYTDINEPWYYYLKNIAIALLPWTPACLIGLLATRRLLTSSAELEANSGRDLETQTLRFLWCWAIAPLLVLSIPKGKHHHYLVPLIAPWAILGAIGVREISNFVFSIWAIIAIRRPWWLPPCIGTLLVGLPGGIAILSLYRKIPEPIAVTFILAAFWMAVVWCVLFAIQHHRASLLVATTMLALLVGYSWAQTMVAGGTDHTIDDTAFLIRAKDEAPTILPLFINAKLGPAGNLDFFRVQFYSRPDARLIHNLSYLRDEQIRDNVVCIITRARDEIKLRQLGTPEILDQSPNSHDLSRPEGRLTLFRLRFNPHLVRYPLPRQLTSLQAMERADGPWCGPKF